MKPWSHLPNAHLIDWALESLKTNPDSWRSAYDATYNAALNAAYDPAWDAAWNAAWNAAYRAAYRAARDATGDAGYNAASVSILALVVYDDCDQYLGMSYEQLKVYAILSERSQAILLLPLKWVQENECMVTPA